jgi:hypothetical protein
MNHQFWSSKLDHDSLELSKYDVANILSGATSTGLTLTIGENSFWKPYFSDSWKTSLNKSDGSIFSDGC